MKWLIEGLFVEIVIEISTKICGKIYAIYKSKNSSELNDLDIIKNNFYTYFIGALGISAYSIIPTIWQMVKAKNVIYSLGFIPVIISSIFVITEFNKIYKIACEKSNKFSKEKKKAKSKSN